MLYETKLRKQLITGGESSVPKTSAECPYYYVPELDKRSLVDRGFFVPKRNRKWSDEERRRLAIGMSDPAATEYLDYYYWLSHHVMNQRRTPAECKRAVRLLAAGRIP